VWVTLLGFLQNNFFIERFSRSALSRALELYPLGRAPRITPSDRARLCRAVSEFMVMNPEFRHDTARLYLSMHGYPRSVRRVLSADPLDLIAADRDLSPRLARLIQILSE